MNKRKVQKKLRQIIIEWDGPAALAAKLDISISTVCRWQESLLPDFKSLSKMADLGIDVRWLLSDNY